MQQNKNKSFQFLDINLLKRVLSLVQPYKKTFFICSALAIVLALLSPIRPYLIQVAVDDYILNFKQQELLIISLVLIGLLLVESVLKYFFSYLTSWLGQSIIKNLRLKIFDHILQLRLRYFDTTPIGTSTTRTINDIEAINEIFSEGIITIVADLLTLITVLFIMFYSDWRLSLISLSVMPLLIISTYYFKEGVRKSYNDVRNQIARLNAFLQEHITGMSIVQIFNAEEKEFEKFKKINEDHKAAHIRSIWYYSIFFPIVEILLAAAIGLMVWWGAHKAISDETTIGKLIAFILYLNMLFRPIRMLADKFNTLQMGMIASERVFKLIDTQEHIENKGNKKLATLLGNIEFDKVWFAYNETDFVLRNISFQVASGKTLAIVGATGAGKSSIINVLNRFYEIQQGQIKIDNINIKEYDLYELRKNIGLVLQDVFLFSGSVMDNITLHNNTITREQVMESAKEVGAHDFISQLPNGYDFNVRERGTLLSTGQRQLISFIRALVFNPKILILDEATSSIDTESEQIIQHAIQKLVKGRTSIVIAHRLSTIQHADNILVLDKGEVKEMGNHAALLQKNGLYKKLHDMQFQSAI